MYTFTEDYYEDKSDGSGQKLIFKAGQQIAWATAYELGVVKTKHPPKEDEKALRKA